MRLECHLNSQTNRRKKLAEKCMEYEKILYPEWFDSDDEDTDHESILAVQTCNTDIPSESVPTTPTVTDATAYPWLLSPAPSLDTSDR